MTVYWISYRLSDDPVPEGSYQDRYDALISALQSCIGEGQIFYHETTSFFVLQTGKSIDYVADAMKRELNASKDHFIIRNMDRRNARIFGENDDLDIYDLMSENGVTYLKDV